MFIKAGKKYIKSSEEFVSMLLGLAIVIVIVSLIFNFVQRKKGTIGLPGSTDISLSENISGKSKEYIVKKGDSLWKIAESQYKDGYVWTEIAKENNIKNVYIIYAGQKLKMPVVETKVIAVVTQTEDKVIIKTENKVNQGEYKVIKNDNLWKIAVMAYGDGYKWTEIWKENKKAIHNPGLIEIGMILKMPKL